MMKPIDKETVRQRIKRALLAAEGQALSANAIATAIKGDHYHVGDMLARMLAWEEVETRTTVVRGREVKGYVLGNINQAKFKIYSKIPASQTAKVAPIAKLLADAPQLTVWRGGLPKEFGRYA